MPGRLTKLTISIFAKQKKDVSTLVLKQTVVVYLSLEGQWCKNKLSFLHNIISWNAKIKKKYRFASFFYQENQRCLALDFLMTFSFPAKKQLLQQNSDLVLRYSKDFTFFQFTDRATAVSLCQSCPNMFPAHCTTQMHSGIPRKFWRGDTRLLH